MMMNVPLSSTTNSLLPLIMMIDIQSILTLIYWIYCCFLLVLFGQILKLLEILSWCFFSVKKKFSVFCCCCFCWKTKIILILRKLAKIVNNNNNKYYKNIIIIIIFFLQFSINQSNIDHQIFNIYNDYHNQSNRNWCEWKIHFFSLHFGDLYNYIIYKTWAHEIDLISLRISKKNFPINFIVREREKWKFLFV